MISTYECVWRRQTLRTLYSADWFCRSCTEETNKKFGPIKTLDGNNVVKGVRRRKTTAKTKIKDANKTKSKSTSDAKSKDPKSRRTSKDSKSKGTTSTVSTVSTSKEKRTSKAKTRVKVEGIVQTPIQPTAQPATPGRRREARRGGVEPTRRCPHHRRVCKQCKMCTDYCCSCKSKAGSASASASTTPKEPLANRTKAKAAGITYSGGIGGGGGRTTARSARSKAFPTSKPASSGASASKGTAPADTKGSKGPDKAGHKYGSGKYRQRPVVQLDPDTGEVIQRFDTASRKRELLPTEHHCSRGH